MSIILSPKPTSSDPFQLERLAEELVSRESSNSNNGDDSTHNLPVYVSLSHDNPYLTAEAFDVEEFLLSRSHTSLQDLRVELRDYLSNLKEELVQLINDDYEAFISLSTDLKGEGARLTSLKSPLASLKQEIQISKSNLCAIQDAIQEKLKKRAALREEKALIHLLLKISESVTRLETLLLISSPSDDSDATEMEGMQMNAGLGTVNGPTDESRENRAKHLSRVASEYTQLLYHATKARTEKCVFVDEIQWRIDRIQSTISSDLDHLFGATLVALTDGRGEDLTECLKTYDMLGLWRDAEDVLRRDVLRPFIKKTIFSGSLTAPHSPLLPHTPMQATKTPGFLSSISGLPPRTPYTPYTSKATRFNPSHFPSKGISPYAHILEESDDPLASLYAQILRFAERDLSRIMDMGEKVSIKSLTSKRTGGSSTPQPAVPIEPISKDGSRGFDILANVIWEELGRSIMDELGSVVFAAGRPNEFKQHYEITQAFIRSIEFLAPSLHSIENMRRHPIYTAFEKRWQLPVYFQLRWKEIVGKVEESFISGQIEYNDKSASSPFKTVQASDLWIAMTACWSAEVFIPELSHRLWKLTLQLLSRYKTWLQTTVLSDSTSRASSAANDKTLAGSRSGTPVSSAEPSSGDTIAQDDATLRKYAAIIADIRTLESSAMALWNEEISMMLPSEEVEQQEEEGHRAEDALQSLLRPLSSLVTPLSKSIVSILIKRGCEALLPVRSIPSQLRAMSNKRPPSEPSPFVTLILRPVKVFFGITSGDGFGAPLKEEFLALYSTDVLEGISQRYAYYITAIKKAEESLSRFKKGQKKTFSLFGSREDENQQSRDEERIRVQITLDVEAFEKDARSLGAKLEESQSFKALSELVIAEPLGVSES
ncbi:conserved oligomeric golgi complex subunit 2-like [Moniliophthora roreri MCA 2997]|uniref:Conserved oligomeric Golgi complex subunit 2 n=1 Tax=Moniliophthora roreri (strain MCA 2997) TaxID=1381753 RepID=V2XX20_MONRO|nr:conserved oligomeric golgi complex subunit 2-like [Moniliophthora roreri MCA 2997]